MDNFSKENSEIILNRAAELQADLSEQLSYEELKTIAQEAGISPQALNLALNEPDDEKVQQTNHKARGPQISEDQNGDQKGFGLDDVIVYTLVAAWIAIAVAILGMGGKSLLRCANYWSLADAIQPHIEVASSSTKFASEEIDLALQKFEGHKLWLNTLNENEKSDEPHGFWQRTFSPPADPALARFHDELTEIADEPTPDPQKVKQLDKDYLQADSLFRSQIYQQAGSDAVRKFFAFLLFPLITNGLLSFIQFIEHERRYR